MKISQDSNPINLIFYPKMSEFLWTEGTYYLEDLTWNQEWARFWQTKFKITITNNYEVIYQSDEGVIIRKQDRRLDRVKEYNDQIVINQKSKLEWGIWEGKLKKSGKMDSCLGRQCFIRCRRMVQLNVQNKHYILKMEKSKEIGQRLSRIILKKQQYMKKENIQMIKDWELGITFTKIKKCNNDLYYKCGGGSYDDHGFKNDNWVEISDNFWSLNKVTYNGNYKNGKKTGKWDTYQKIQLITGGQYNENGLKVGQWIDLVENFLELSEVTYFGEHNEGKKIGSQIGGGSQDDNDLKNGIWIEQCYNFAYEKQITYVGEYKNGKKVGRWNINYRKNEDPFQQIGGGIYNKSGLKIGIWVEENYNFKISAQITESGEYQNGKKLGRWNIQYENAIIGGGYYNEQCMKIGKWIDLDEKFLDIKEVLCNGEYDNRRKMGIWVILYKKSSNKQLLEIGGGTCIDEGVKNGTQQNLSQYFLKIRGQQVVIQKQYECGFEIGQLKVMTRKDSNQSFQDN